jgi:hypothetical protein
VIRQRFFLGHCAGIQHNHVLNLFTGCRETLHPLFEFASQSRPVLSHAPGAGVPAHFGRLGLSTKKSAARGSLSPPSVLISTVFCSLPNNL